MQIQFKNNQNINGEYANSNVIQKISLVFLAFAVLKCACNNTD